MPERYRVRRYKTSLTIPVGLNTISATVADVSVNGLLRGVIVNVPLVDTSLISVSDSANVGEFIDFLPNVTRAVRTSDTLTTAETIGINHAG